VEGAGRQNRDSSRRSCTAAGPHSLPRRVGEPQKWWERDPQQQWPPLSRATGSVRCRQGAARSSPPADGNLLWSSALPPQPYPCHSFSPWSLLQHLLPPMVILAALLSLPLQPTSPSSHSAVFLSQLPSVLRPTSVSLVQPPQPFALPQASPHQLLQAHGHLPTPFTPFFMPHSVEGELWPTPTIHSCCPNREDAALRVVGHRYLSYTPDSCRDSTFAAVSCVSPCICSLVRGHSHCCVRRTHGRSTS